MIQQSIYYTSLFILLANILLSCEQTPTANGGYWTRFDDEAQGSGYKNNKGDIVIPAGKYPYCHTDTFRTYAIVAKPDVGMVAIDKKESILYKVFVFDNGPDETSEGVFRIVENDLIGFADALTGKVVIKPQFKCAFPFKNGTAQVSNDCKIESDGEHSIWLSDHWQYIDKIGNKVMPTK